MRILLLIRKGTVSSAAFVLAGTVLLASCGGGGGGNGGGGGGGGSDDDDDPASLLAAYDFAISNPDGAPGELIRSSLSGGVPASVYEIDAGTGTIRGEYVRASGDMTIAATTTYAVNWTTGGPSPTDFTVAFNQEATLPSDDFQPGGGSFTVTWAGNTIDVSYGADSTDVALNGGSPVSFLPSDFVLLDSSSTAPDWQRVASMASGSLTDMLRRAGSVAGFLESIFDGELDSGTAVVPCTEFPGDPPSGVSQSGEFVAIDMGAGAYEITATDCFSQLTGQPVGVLLTGTASYRNLVTTESNGIVTRAGFEGSTQTNGGVNFDLRQRFVRESLPLVWTFEDFEDRLNGGFSLVFTQP